MTSDYTRFVHIFEDTQRFGALIESANDYTRFVQQAVANARRLDAAQRQLGSVEHFAHIVRKAQRIGAQVDAALSSLSQTAALFDHIPPRPVAEFNLPMVETRPAGIPVADYRALAAENAEQRAEIERLRGELAKLRSDRQN